MKIQIPRAEVNKVVLVGDRSFVFGTTSTFQFNQRWAPKLEEEAARCDCWPQLKESEIGLKLLGRTINLCVISTDDGPTRFDNVKAIDLAVALGFKIPTS